MVNVIASAVHPIVESCDLAFAAVEAKMDCPKSTSRIFPAAA